MATRWPRLLPCVLACVFAPSCTYSLSDPCDSNSKACNGQCVAIDDPAYGCAIDACQPCALPEATCASGTCSAPSCSEGLGDCDPAVPGCETTLFDNDEHCGRCGYDCLESSCQGVVCKAIALASEQNRAYEVVVDDQYVFWTDDTILDASVEPAMKRSVGRAPKAAMTDTEAEVCAEIAGSSARGITLSDDQVYWVDKLLAKVFRVPKTCDASPSQLHEMQVPDPPPRDDEGPELETIVFASGTLYFTDARKGSPYGNVWALAADGSGPAVALLPEPESGSPWWLAIDDTHVYWTNYTDGLAKRAPRRGGPAECVGSSAAGATGAWGIAVDETSVYYRFEGVRFEGVPFGGGLRAADKAAGTCGGVDLVPVGEPEILARDLAQHGDDLYWVRGQGLSAEIVTACKDGSGLRVLQAAEAHGLAVDDTHVYWTTWSDTGQGGVYRVARPPSACAK